MSAVAACAVLEVVWVGTGTVVTVPGAAVTAVTVVSA
jgi:hypothetical protein